ncbi:MAG: bifunctional folylpolyglutamate synthase/dihydrofolate synthase [Lachnospiraceae bacterium]
MTFENAMSHMEEIQKKGSILGLGPVKELLNRLGNPQNNEKVIHVAGTNGKGSICTFLEQLYRAEGKKVGRYISPTLHCYLERFQINGEYMEEDTFASLFSHVYQILCDMERDGLELPTAFEVETAIAFLYFRQVDIVILETGMGGREDATNVVIKPLCTVFASIGMDHMQFLGDTIEKIAYEKAGIMKKGCMAVGYPNDERVNKVLYEHYMELNEVDIISKHKDNVAVNVINEYKDTMLVDIISKHKDDLSVDIIGKHNEDSWQEHYDEYSQKEENNAGIYFVNKEDVVIKEEKLCGSTFIYEGEEYSISLGGRYQIYNGVTAIKTKLLLDGHLKKEALLNARWEGRFEQISENPLFIKDGAHNVDGVLALKESVEKHFTNHHLIFIIGVLRDKEYEKMMEIMCPLAKKVYTITPPVERGLAADVLAKAVKPYCNQVTCCETIEEAVFKAKKDAETIEHCGIIAWGSLSYIGEL